MDLELFSKRRLRGESIPDDLRAVLQHADEFGELTGIEVSDEEHWAPWLDTSYLSAAERSDPDIAANVRAISAVSDLIAFVAELEEGEYLGYWLGPEKRHVAESPLIRLDNEGQFQVLSAASFAGAVLEQNFGNQVEELRDWFSDQGVEIPQDRTFTALQQAVSPGSLHRELYEKFLGEDA